MAITAAALVVAGVGPARSAVFPADAGVIDVTQFGVTPNDGLDDTAALQAVINQFNTNKQIIYLPDGVYDLSDTLVIPRAPGSGAVRNVLQGQSQSGAVLKLANNLQRSDGSAFDGAILNFEPGGSANYFENVVRNLTFDIGSGNALASGLEFNASNQGTARDLTIRSGDGSGFVGLDVGYADNIGPLLIKNIEVDGFDTGIRSQFQVASKVLEDITVRNQNVVGFENSNTSTVMLRNFRSENDVTAISNSIPLNSSGGNPGNGRLTLLDSQLLTVDGAPAGTAAIQNANGNSAPTLYARNVEIGDYTTAVNNPQQTFRGNRWQATDHIEEYWYTGPSGGFRNYGCTYQLFDNTPDTGLGLPIRETPESPDNPVEGWVSPLDFGGNPNDLIDDTAAIQAAIDSGAKTVYLPNGEWVINGTVTVRGEVEQIVGTEALLHRTNTTGKVVIADGTADTVFIERMTGGRLGSPNPVRFEHDTDRELVFKHISNLNYVPVAENPGDLFLEDVVGGKRENADIAEGAMIFRNQNVWARQYNNEVFADTNDPTAPDAKVLVDNANVWILGYKAERSGTLVKVINGGKAEVLGVYFTGGSASDADNPAFVTEESALSVNGFSISPGNPGWETWARETRNGVTVESARFSEAEVYSAFDDQTLWDLRQEIYLDDTDTRGVTLNGEWGQSESFPGGFIGEYFSYSDDPDASAEYTPDFPVDGEYEVLIRLVGDWFNQDHSGHSDATPITITSEDGTTEIVLDQGGFAAEDSGIWVSLGTYLFAQELLGQGVTISPSLSDNPNADNIIADGVRFVLVPEPSALLALVGLLLVAPASGRRRGPRG
ncbi:MAG: glycosyl hydrolase family 28-related protein [Planctomycetota bacterium]